jgi:Flp pilus assembly pilin Flp
MLTKCINKIFALDGRSSAMEYGIITLLLAAAVLSSVIAVGDSVADAWLRLLGNTVASLR